MVFDGSEVTVRDILDDAISLILVVILVLGLL